MSILIKSRGDYFEIPDDVLKKSRIPKERFMKCRGEKPDDIAKLVQSSKQEETKNFVDLSGWRRNGGMGVSSERKAAQNAAVVLSDTLVPSRFNVSVDLHENRKAVYNTFTGALVILTDEKWRKHLVSGVELELSDGRAPESIRLLHSKGLFVSKGVDEIELVRLQYISDRHNKDTLKVNILATLECNLRCPYCFQGKNHAVNGRKTMTREVEDAVASFIGRLAKGKRRAYVHWLGGEPLLDIGSIERISSKLAFVFKDENIECNGIITTNGTLLRRVVVEKLVGSGVTQAQVTVDVPREAKKDNRGRDTLEIVLDNISLAAEKLEIHMCINLSHDDEREFDQLYSSIIKRNLHRRLKSIHIIHVFVPECSRSEGALSTLQHQSYIEVERRERVKARDLGLPMKILLPMNSITGCIATREASMQIGPDGLLYKCVEDVGLVERAYGSVFQKEDIKFNNLLPWLTYDWFKYEMCKECPVLPQCAGGCPHKRLFQSDSLKEESFCCWHIRGDLENRIREVALNSNSC